MKPCVYGQITFDQSIKNKQWRNENLFNEWCWKNWKPTCIRVKLSYGLFPCTKIKSKLFKDLNIRSETINYIEENIGTKLMDFGLEKIL